MAESTMTKGERDELAKILKRRARVAKSAVAQRKAELLADVERQLATQHKADDAAWAHITRAVAQAIKDGNGVILAEVRARGFPAAFAPKLVLAWSSRGENGAASRRAELRKVAQTRLDVMEKEAKVAIETAELEGLTRLATGALTSDDARAFLAAMPSLKELMPALSVADLGPMLALP